jgi:hypothetical protein
MKLCKTEGEAEFSAMDNPLEPADLGFLGKLARDQDEQKATVLADLLSGMTADNLHNEISFGRPMGIEII